MNNNINIIIDSHSVAWRCYYSMKDLSHEDIPTGVLYGFLKQLEIYYNKFYPCSFAFAWDSKKQYRKLEYPEYKQKRKAQTKEEKEKKQAVAEQINILRTYILPSFGFNQSWKLTGFEADDIIAKYVIKNHQKNKKSLVISGDEDMYQLLFYTDIYNPAKNNIITEKTFYKKYNIDSGEWAQVKSIGGCASDNVQGIEGVGEKKAIEFIKDNMNYTTKTYKKIVNNLDKVLFYSKLVTLPHEKCPELSCKKKNVFDEEGFEDVCEVFGLDSILSNKILWYNIVNTN